MTRNLRRLAAVLEALERGGVAHTVRCNGLASVGRGMPGMRQDAAATYWVYVHKGQLEKVRHLLRGAAPADKNS